MRNRNLILFSSLTVLASAAINPIREHPHSVIVRDGQWANFSCGIKLLGSIKWRIGDFTRAGYVYNIGSYLPEVEGVTAERFQADITGKIRTETIGVLATEEMDGVPVECMYIHPKYGNRNCYSKFALIEIDTTHHHSTVSGVVGSSVPIDPGSYTISSGTLASNYTSQTAKALLSLSSVKKENFSIGLLQNSYYDSYSSFTSNVSLIFNNHSSHLDSLTATKLDSISIYTPLQSVNASKGYLFVKVVGPVGALLFVLASAITTIAIWIHCHKKRLSERTPDYEDIPGPIERMHAPLQDNPAYATLQ